MCSSDLLGMGPDADPAVADDQGIDSLIRSAVKDASSPVHGRDPDEIRAMLDRPGRRGPARMVDLMLQTGPYGAGFGANPNGASLDLLLANPHGVDFGALDERIPEALRTRSGKVELAADPLIDDVSRLFASISELQSRDIVLVGRRHLKSNNSWMHNIGVLMKGSMNCSLHVHPIDADRFGLRDGAYATISSRVGTVTAPVEITEGIRPGVVSLPHGWGHDAPGTRMAVAAEKAGVNSNVLSDDRAMDPLSGTSVLNGIPVSIAPAQ